MHPIRNLIDAVRQFRLTRRYDYPVLFFLVQSVITLTKFSILVAVFVAGYLFIEEQFTPEQYNDTIVANPGPTVIADANPVTGAIAKTVAATRTPESKTDNGTIAPGQEPAFAAANRQNLATGTTSFAEPIAPDSAIALLLAKLDQTRSESADLDADETANREVHYRARVQWTNVRREPSAAAPIIVSLDTDQEVRIVMQKGSWVQIQSDEIDTKDGYVLASLLEPVDRGVR